MSYRHHPFELIDVDWADSTINTILRCKVQKFEPGLRSPSPSPSPPVGPVHPGYGTGKEQLEER
jgi:hypothetical protein